MNYLNKLKIVYFIFFVFFCLTIKSVFSPTSSSVSEMRLEIWRGTSTSQSQVVYNSVVCSNANSCSFNTGSLSTCSWATGSYYAQWVYFEYADYSNTRTCRIYGSSYNSNCVGIQGYFLFTLNEFDSDSSRCTNCGYSWFSNLGTWVGSNYPCCGDDGSSDSFATYSGSLTTSQSVSCRRCNAGSNQGTTTLYGNGYWTGNTCYYGDITCTASSASHGASVTTPCSAPNTYCLRTDFSPNRCYYNVACGDGTYNVNTYQNCPPTQFSGGICYYDRACTSTGCQYNSQNRPPNQPSSISVNPSCAGSSTTVTVSATVSDPDGDQVKLQVCQDLECGTVLCTSSAVSSGNTASCQFTASSACSTTGSCTIYVRTRENSADPCGQTKTSSTTSTSFNYDVSAPNAPTGLNPSSGTTVDTSTPTLSWSSTSDVGCGGINRYEVYVYSSTDCSGTAIRSNTAVTGTSWQVSPALSDGNYSWRVRAVDNFGLVGAFSTCNIINILTDNTPPVTNINPNGGTSANDFTVTLTCTDDKSGCQATYYKIINDGDSCGSSGFSTYTGAFSVSCGAGSVCRKRVCYYSVDNAGNVESTKTSNVFLIDKQAPTGTIDYPDTVYTINTVRIYLSASDEGCGLATAQVQQQTAPLNADDTCGTFGTWSNVGDSDPSKTYLDVTLTQNNTCYRFRYVITDQVGLQYIATSTSTLKTRIGHSDYYCGLRFVDPSFYLRTTQGTVVGRIDSQGNFFIAAPVVIFNNPTFPTPTNALVIRNSTNAVMFYFNQTHAQFRGTLISRTSVPDAVGDLLIRNITGGRLALFSATGTAYIQGYRVHHGSTETCPPSYLCNASKNFNCYK